MRKAVAALFIISTFLMLTVNVAQFREVAATNPSTQWIKDIGSFSLGRGHSVIQTADGSYAITGGKDGGFLLLKTSSSGDVQWKKTYGTEAEFTSFANAIVQAADGGYVLAGQGTPWPNFIGPNGTLFNLLKTDAAGNMQWNHSYSTEETPFLATSLIKTSDGGYAVAGYAETGHSIMSSGTGFVCLVKTDGAGNMQWKKQFEADALWAQFHISVVETGDAGYALLTVADFTVNAVPVVENVDFWLIKTDSDGDMQWSKTYGGAHNDLPYAFVETADGGFLLCGETQSFGAVQADGWLVKTDSEGNMLWNKTYGGDGWDVISSVLETKDGGYVVAAMIDASSENPPSGALIFRIDTSGNTEWTVEYQGVTQPVLSPMYIIETEDGAYVFSGFKPRTDSTEPMSIVLVKLMAPSTISEDSWTAMEPMPTARRGLGVAVVDDKIYAIGGTYGIQGGYDNNEEYDPVTDTWTTKNPMPTQRGDFAIAVFQDKIYTIGGSIKAGQWTTELTDVNEVYDPATDTWTTKTSMSIPKGGLSASVVDGKIYLIGGFTQSPDGFRQTSKENLVYDPIADSWTTKTPIPTAALDYATAVVDDKIYVISGTSRAYSDNLINLNQIYDPKTDTWSQGAPIPCAVQQAAAGATMGIAAPKTIYVMGGFTGFYWPTNLTQVYHPENDTWSFGAYMPTPLYDLGVAIVKDHLYAIGGSPFYLQPATDQNNQYTPIGYIPEFPSWTPIYIRSDGTVEGTDKIQRDGNVYTFIDSINGSIIVERDSVVVDGAGYTLQGTGADNSKGIYVEYRSNITIKNLQIKDFDYGIRFLEASNNTITGNHITITNLKEEPWIKFGILLGHSSKNSIIGNNITNYEWGIGVTASDNNTISKNKITNNFRGLDFTASENNTVTGNYIANNTDGIALENMYNNIVENTITNNSDIGIFLNGAGYNKIIGNNITNNKRGIVVSICYNNVIHHNNFVNNTNHVETDDSNDIWDNGEEGNYWDNYTGIDNDDDGIGDTPYAINENNQDNNPLMNPWIPPNQKSEPFPITWILVIIGIIAIVGVAILVFFIKTKKTRGEVK